LGQSSIFQDVGMRLQMVRACLFATYSFTACFTHFESHIFSLPKIKKVEEDLVELLEAGTNLDKTMWHLKQFDYLQTRFMTVRQLIDAFKQVRPLSADVTPQRVFQCVYMSFRA
jgi:hypothetical protein